MSGTTMEVDGEPVPNDARPHQDEPVTEEKRLLQYVKSFVDQLTQQAAKDEQTNISPWGGHNSILCIGRNSARLRLIAYIFGHYLAVTVREDIHLLRSNYLPDLVTIEGAVSLLDNLDQAQHLEYLKICYSNAEFGALMKHLLSTKETAYHSLPAAIIVDDLSGWLRKAPIAQPAGDAIAAPEPQNATEDVAHLQKHLYNLSGLLIETVNYCSRRLHPPPSSQTGLLIVTLDLDHLSQELFGNNPPDDALQKENAFIQPLIRQYQHRIDVDLLDG